MAVKRAKDGPLAAAQQKGLRRLLAQAKLRPECGEPETDLQILARLAARIEEIKNPHRNPYRSDFTKFRTCLCWTKDEARAGRVALIPDYPYLREVDDAVLRHSPLLVDKARRQLISWHSLAFDLWLIGGGYDPRWPALMPTDENPNGGNRKVIIAARKLEDENGSADFLSRIAFLYDQFEERGGREKWPDFPEIRFSYSRGVASNGGLLSAVPQGKDQLAGSGVTRIHAEEFSRWTEQKSSVGSALQTLMGDADMEGGKITLICTAQADTHAAHIVMDKLRDRDGSARRVAAWQPKTEAERILPPVKRTNAGWYILQVPFGSRPGPSFQEACVGMDESEIQTDLLRNWLATSGLRVYPEFDFDLHVSKADLEYDPDEPLRISFDWGLSPACCIGQLSSYGQLQIFPSFHPAEREYEGIYAFAEKVADHLLQTYCAPYDRTLAELPLVVTGDPMCRAKGQHGAHGKKAKEAVSCSEILFRGLELDLGLDENGRQRVEKLPGWGWRVIPGDVSHKKRQDAVRYRLKTLVHRQPALIVDHREEFIQSAFLGGYQFPEHSDGTYGQDPLKNEASHVMNALEYMLTRLSARPMPKDEEDDEVNFPKHEFRSQASASRWR